MRLVPGHQFPDEACVSSVPIIPGHNYRNSHYTELTGPADVAALGEAVGVFHEAMLRVDTSNDETAAAFLAGARLAHRLFTELVVHEADYLDRIWAIGFLSLAEMARVSPAQFGDMHRSLSRFENLDAILGELSSDLTGATAAMEVGFLDSFARGLAATHPADSAALRRTAMEKALACVSDPPGELLDLFPIDTDDVDAVRRRLHIEARDEGTTLTDRLLRRGALAIIDGDRKALDAILRDVAAPALTAAGIARGWEARVGPL